MSSNTEHTSEKAKRPAPIQLSNSVINFQEEMESPIVPLQMSPFDDYMMEIMEEIKFIVRYRKFGDPILTKPAFILENLYLGDASHAMSEDIFTMGITAILNCAPDGCLTNREYYGPEILYNEINAKDIDDYNMIQYVNTIYDFYQRCQMENRILFVHCAAGINRSAFVTIIIYMITTGTKIVDAVRHCFSARPIILTNESFIEQLVRVAYKLNLL